MPGDTVFIFPCKITIGDPFSSFTTSILFQLILFQPNPNVFNTASEIQSHTTSNPTSISQEAAYAAIAGSQEEVEKMRAEFDRRRKYMVERLNKMEGVSCPVPYGAFYAFANFSSFVGKGEITDDCALSSYLLEEAKVAVVPGSAFGAPNYLRLSYATSFENIKKGLDRIQEATHKLKEE